MIGTPQDLTDFLPKLQLGQPLALDTEADSLHAYPEKLCLIQVRQAGWDVLIDPLAGLDLGPFFDALRDQELILHGADYDLRLLRRTFEFVPRAIFDTMWAARLLGDTEFGLQSLVQQQLGVTLEKGPQKMNWAVRPLPARMAAYALNDTRHLAPLAELLRARLTEKGRLSWFAEVCAKVIRDCSRARTPDPDALWRVKGAERLAGSAMAILKELWHWREEEAVTANKPPYFILSHEKLIAISAAASQGRPVQNLVPPHLPARRADRLGAALDRGLKVPSSEYPQPRRAVAIRLSKGQQQQFDRWKEVRDRRAAELAMIRRSLPARLTWFSWPRM